MEPREHTAGCKSSEFFETPCIKQEDPVACHTAKEGHILIQTLIATLTSTAAISAFVSYFTAKIGSKTSIDSAIISGRLQAESAIDQIELQAEKERSIFLLKEQAELYGDISEWMHDLEVCIDDVIAAIYDSDNTAAEDAKSIRVKIDEIPWGISRTPRNIARRMYLLSPEARQETDRAVQEFLNLHNPAQVLVNDKYGDRPDSPISKSMISESLLKDRKSAAESEIFDCKRSFYKMKNEVFRCLSKEIGSPGPKR